MKKIICLSIISFSLLSILKYHNSKEARSNPIKARIVLNLKERIEEENAYSEKSEKLNNPRLREVLMKYGIPSIQSVFRNQYYPNGKMKNMEKASRNQLNGWFYFSAEMSQERISKLIQELLLIPSVLSAVKEISLSVKVDFLNAITQLYEAELMVFHVADDIGKADE